MKAAMDDMRDPEVASLLRAEEALNDLRAEVRRLRKAIQDYLDGNWGTRLPRKIDKCPHDKFGWEDCGNCIDEYFASVLNPPAEGKSL